MKEKIIDFLNVSIIFITLLVMFIFTFGGLLGGFIYLWKMILN